MAAARAGFPAGRCHLVGISILGKMPQNASPLPAARSGERVRERGSREMPPLPGPLLHKSVEEREKSNVRKN